MLKEKTRGSPKSKKSLEENLLLRILAVSKKSKNPFAIAKAYGILVEKASKSPSELRSKIEKIAKALLDEIDRAASESTSPNNIAIAFGIIMDKRGFLVKNRDAVPKEESKPISDPKAREKEYRDLLGEESSSAEKQG